MKKTLWCGLLFLSLFTLQGQEVSNAYRVTWQESVPGKNKITGVDLLTGFNRSGYNNQPAVSGDILYLSSSWKESKNDRTNLIALNLKTREAKRITATPEQEYSPAVFQKDLYFVRMDPEDQVRQLWKYDGKKLQKVLPESNVAYFTPMKESRMGVVLIEDQKLVLYDIDLKTNDKKLISREVGHSLAVGQNQKLYFVHKYSPQSWYIKSYDPLTGQIKIVCNTVKDAEDLYLTPQDFLWMAKGSRLYKIGLEEAIGNEWKNILDLKEYGLNNIKRICVINENNLILINQ